MHWLTTLKDSFQPNPEIAPPSTAAISWRLAASLLLIGTMFALKAALLI